MGEKYVALVRGINVGRAKRVAMADLRNLFTELSYQDVRTLLNSGNVVFDSPDGVPVDRTRIEKEMEQRLRVVARVVLLAASDFASIVEENPLLDVADDPSRLLVLVLADPRDCRLLKPLLKEDWLPERIGLGERAAYLWCPRGLLESRLQKAAGQLLGDAVTTRNWSTIIKINELLTPRNIRSRERF